MGTLLDWLSLPRGRQCLMPLIFSSCEIHHLYLEMVMSLAFRSFLPAINISFNTSTSCVFSLSHFCISVNLPVFIFLSHSSKALFLLFILLSCCSKLSMYDCCSGSSCSFLLIISSYSSHLYTRSSISACYSSIRVSSSFLNSINLYISSYIWLICTSRSSNYASTWSNY